MQTTWWGCKIVGLIVLLALAGCASELTDEAEVPSSARAVVTVRWPARARAARLVPRLTESITLALTGPADFSTETTITRPETGDSASVAFDPVPVGVLTLRATAYPQAGAGGIALASGEARVETVAGAQVDVALAMQSTIVTVALTPPTARLEAGATLQLSVTPRDVADATVLIPSGGIAWDSSDPAVATVTQAGVVEAVGPGTATISATELESGTRGIATVTVPADVAGKIAFVSDRDGNAEIYIMNADGSNLRRLTTTAAQEDEISISPDGSRIAYISNRAGTWHVYVMNSDGSGVRQLTTGSQDCWRPSFSPDGRRITYFVSAATGNDEIYVMNSDGAVPSRLTRNDDMDVVPVFTPNGREIVFASNREGSYELYRMGENGGTASRLTTGGGMKMYHDVCRTDGRIAATVGGRLVLDAGGPLVGYVAGGQIGTMEANGSGLRLLSGAGEATQPCWSPDGSAIAYAGRQGGKWSIYTMKADGTGQRRLTNSGANDWYPAWAP